MTFFLTVALITATALFESKLKQSQIQYDLVAEKKTIRNQSVVFCIGFIVRSCYSFWRLWMSREDMNKEDGYIVAIICILSYVPWSILPLAMVFYVHHTTYKKQLNSLAS